MAANRREVLKTWLAGAVGSNIPGTHLLCADESAGRRPKLPVAAIVSVYTPNSHADVLVGKILEGYQQDGGPGPDLKVVSIFTDQVPEKDMSRSKAAQHGFRISPSIHEAMTLGTDTIQVAGVLCIGEHGDYPKTPDTGQRMYPRRRFFDEVVSVFRKCGQVVPVFNDKHLGYRWEDARAMVATARELRFPLMAGSSLPVAWRMPPLNLPAESLVESALSVGYGGFEDYGFHALEAHQCLLEQRQGGETGIKAVRALQGERIRAAEKNGDWSAELLEVACRQMPGGSAGIRTWNPGPNSAVYLLEHRDGLRSAVLMANGLAAHFSTAVRVKNTTNPLATWFKLQERPPFGHFACLLHAIAEMMHTGRAVYPVERTLLTTGILDRVMHSLANDGERCETPELAIEYPAATWPFANHPDSRLRLPND